MMPIHIRSVINDPISRKLYNKEEKKGEKKTPKDTSQYQKDYRKRFHTINTIFLAIVYYPNF